jgi:hypothetical protein
MVDIQDVEITLQAAGIFLLICGIIYLLLVIGYRDIPGGDKIRKSDFMSFVYVAIIVVAIPFLVYNSSKVVRWISIKSKGEEE